MSRWNGIAAGAAVFSDGSTERFGPTDQRFELASITKLYTAMAALVAHEEGTIDLDTDVGDGFNPADVLAHSAGIAPDERSRMAAPRTRRIYSTAAYDLLADMIAQRAAMPFAAYANEAVAQPLGMSSITLTGSAGAGAFGSVDDLLALIDAWRRPLLIDQRTLSRAITPHLGDLDGVLPGFGNRTPNPWGLGPEIRGDKDPHWTAPANDPRTYGHFGRAGTMLWIDPVADIALVALSDQPFGPWAATAWPILSSAVLSSSR
ncbi:MAG: serine hydrolase domain-containing protein [Actinomycetota bacterium]